MISKEAFRFRLTSLIALTGKTQEEISQEVGYGKNYISEVLSPTGKLTDKFLAAFNRYVDGLENPKNEQPDYMRALLDLAESNKKLANTNGELVQIQKDLVRMLKISSGGI